MNRKTTLLLLLLPALVLVGCQSDETEPIPDVSGVDIDLDLRRFEQDLFGLDTNNLGSELDRLESEYPLFSAIYFEQVLGANDPAIAPQGKVEYIRGFLQHPSVRHLYDTTMVVYRDISDIRDQYREALQFYRFYFPEEPLPGVTTFISEYSLGGFIYDNNALAISLDFFLGEHYPYEHYNPNNSNFSAYLTRTFNRDHLVAKSLHPLADEMLGPPQGNRMLDMMIYNGKKLYLLDHLLPHAPDSVILEISGSQTAWLKDNELEMWAYFLQEDLLYSTTWQDIRKFVEYSPHSPGMPPEAPGRTANFVGWRIVSAYMKRHPETTMQKLMELNDAQDILTQSRYKPGRR